MKWSGVEWRAVWWSEVEWSGVVTEDVEVVEEVVGVLYVWVWT